MAGLRIPITNVYGGGDYTGQILVGSQQTPANVILDTGSATLAVKPAVYNPATDTALKATSWAQDVIYGTGAWAGPVVQTRLAVGSGPGAISTPVGPIALTDDAAPSNFGPADGILGLAYNPLNGGYDMTAYLTKRHIVPPVTYPWKLPQRNTQSAIEQFGKVISALPPVSVTPFFTQLVQANLAANKFAFYTKRSAPKPTATDPENAGWFILGGGEEQTDLYSGTFIDVDVVDDAWYNTTLVSVQVGNQPPIAVAPLTTAQAQQMGSNSIVDSGTNSLAMSSAVFEAVIAAFGAIDPALGTLANQATQAQNQGQGLQNSQINLAAWPNISFTLVGDSGANVTLTCTPATYWQLDAFQAGTAMFQINQMGMDQTILGLPLFNNYYVVFDRSVDISGVIRFAPIA